MDDLRARWRRRMPPRDGEWTSTHVAKELNATQIIKNVGAPPGDFSVSKKKSPLRIVNLVTKSDAVASLQLRKAYEHLGGATHCTHISGPVWGVHWGCNALHQSSIAPARGAIIGTTLSGNFFRFRIRTAPAGVPSGCTTTMYYYYYYY